MSNVVAGHDYHKGIPGWCAFESIYYHAIGQVKDFRPRIFVEIGCWQGRSACLMAQLIRNADKPVKLFCIDPWDDGGPDLWATTYYQELKKPLRELFDEHTAPYQDIIIPLQMKSTDAVANFQDGTIDFLMIDGDHTYEGVRKDIDAYLPKMRPGSIIAGDDYLWPGVKKAADETFGKKLVPVIRGNGKGNYKNSVAHWWVQL